MVFSTMFYNYHLSIAGQQSCLHNGNLLIKAYFTNCIHMKLPWREKYFLRAL